MVAVVAAVEPQAARATTMQARTNGLRRWGLVLVPALEEFAEGDFDGVVEGGEVVVTGDQIEELLVGFGADAHREGDSLVFVCWWHGWMGADKNQGGKDWCLCGSRTNRSGSRWADGLG